MPENTPIYGFTYPCPGEDVDAAAFALLAGQLDTKMADVNADWFYALNRYNTHVPAGSTQVLAAGVEVTLTTIGSTFTVPVAGVWAFKAALQSTVAPATITAWRARIAQNGVAKYGETQNEETNLTLGPQPRVMLPCAAGDAITVVTFYTGTGTMTVNCQISAKQICRIA